MAKRLIMLVLAGWGLVFAPTVCRADMLTGCCTDIAVPAAPATCADADCQGDEAPASGAPVHESHEDETCHDGCCADVRSDDGPAPLPGPMPTHFVGLLPVEDSPGASPSRPADLLMGIPHGRDLPFPPSDRPLLI